MNFTTRSKAVSVTLLLTILYFIALIYKKLIATDIDIALTVDIISSITMSVVMFFGIWWVVEFRVKYFRVFTVLLFPALFILVVSIFADLSLFQSVFRLSGTLMSIVIGLFISVISYFLILSSNILNVSSVSGIPLERAAKTAQYVFSLLFTYFSIMLVNSLSLNIWVKIICMIIIFTYVCYQTFWILSLPANKLHFISLTTSLLLSVSLPVLYLWPIKPEFIALFYTTSLYVILGRALDRTGGSNVGLIFEYSIVVLVVTLYCIISAVWGINGRLI